jgi:hypothetical protein
MRGVRLLIAEAALLIQRAGCAKAAGTTRKNSSKRAI